MNTTNRISIGKRIFILAVALGALLAICIGVSVLTAQWVMNRGGDWEEHDRPHGHHWLHEELSLTEEEAAAIDSFEGDYRSERSALLEQFNERIAELSDLLVNQAEYSPEVNVAIHRIHEVHGRLQELSIEHYYDMLSVLPPEKQEKLRQLAVTALSQPE